MGSTHEFKNRDPALIPLAVGGGAGWQPAGRRKELRGRIYRPTDFRASPAAPPRPPEGFQV
jgi:hypothetical protein